MKRTIAALFLAAAILFGAAPVSAHSGRTDASGGHNDTQNASGLGAYHYHHGLDAHLHPGGICPYGAEPELVTVSATVSAGSGNETSSGAASSTALPAVTTGALPEAPTVYKINVTESSVYETASAESAVLTMAPKDYAFSPTGVTKSFWQITFWLGEDANTLYTGYVRKSDCAIVSL